MHDVRTVRNSDHKWISLDEAGKVLNWTHELRCTESDLRAAVKMVGNSPVAVRNFLARQGKGGKGGKDGI